MVNRNRGYRLGLYEKAMPAELNWEEKLEHVKRGGFDYLEMSIDETEEKLQRLDYTEKECQKILAACIKTGIPIESICLSAHRRYPLGSHDHKIRRQALVIMEKAIKLARCLGIRFIQLAGYDVFYEKSDVHTQCWFLENLQICVQLASQYGVILGFETMETGFMDTVEKAMAYVDCQKSPYLGIYPDIGNLKNASLIYNVEVNDDILKGEGHIIAAHLKETKPGIYREVPFGEGHSEFVKNIEVLRTMGVGMFVAEFWYTDTEKWQDSMKQANIFLRKKFDNKTL